MKRQVEFVEVNGNGHVIGWVDDDRVRVGAKVTLRGYPDQKWMVKSISALPEGETVNRSWPVGGMK